MKVFLDDVRAPIDCIPWMHDAIYLEEWVVVRNYEDFQGAILEAYVNDEEITHISFDHDLGEDTDGKYNREAIDGYECAKWFEDYYSVHNMEHPVILVHSLNPVGAERIKRVFFNEEY